MQTDPKKVLVSAAAIMSYGAIGQASKSPELAFALANFDWETNDGQESGEIRGDKTFFDDGPTSMLSKALDNPDNKNAVDAILRDYDSAITENLAPAVDQFRRVLGLPG